MKMYLPPRGNSRRTRRSVLKRGLFGGVLLALGGGTFLALRGSGDPVLPAKGLVVLNPRELAVLQAVAARMIPRRAGWPTPEALEVGAACDRILLQVDDTARAETKQLLMLFENALAGFLFGRRTLPFTRLEPDDQEKVLDEWRTSAITVRRTGYLALRTLVDAAYYGQSQVWPSVGYPGPTPGIHDPNAPVWKGGGEPRPLSNGIYVVPPGEAAP